MEIENDQENTNTEQEDKSSVESLFAEMSNQVDAEEAEETTTEEVVPEESTEDPEETSEETTETEEVETAPEASESETGADDQTTEEEKPSESEEKAKEESEETTGTEEEPDRPEFQPPTFEEIQEALTHNRESVMQAMTERYQFTDEQKAQFEENPTEVLPQLAAQISTDVFSTVWATIVTQFPNLMKQTQNWTSEVTSWENKFYGDYPELADSKPEVAAILKSFRDSNPNMEPEEFMKKGALMASFTLGKITPEKATELLKGMGAVEDSQEETPENKVPPKPATTTPSVQPAPSNSAPGTVFEEMAEEVAQQGG